MAENLILDTKFKLLILDKYLTNSHQNLYPAIFEEKQFNFIHLEEKMWDVNFAKPSMDSKKLEIHCFFTLLKNSFFRAVKSSWKNTQMFNKAFFMKN